MPPFTLLREFNTRAEADLAKGILNSHNINTVIRSDDCGGMAGGLTFVRGVKLMVASADLNNARELLGMPEERTDEQLAIAAINTHYTGNTPQAKIYSKRIFGITTRHPAVVPATLV